MACSAAREIFSETDIGAAADCLLFDMITWLQQSAKEARSTATDYLREYNNPEEDARFFGRQKAFEEIIDKMGVKEDDDQWE